MRFAQLKTYIGSLIVIVFLELELLGCTTNPTPISDAPLQPTMTVTKTATAVYSPTPTYTPLTTMTLTPLPSLEPTQATEKLRELLMRQELCQSPCLWGITPNQTTLGEAQNIFNRLGLNLTHTLQKGGKDFYATSFGFESGLDVPIVLRVQDGLVDSLRTNIGLANYKSPSPAREWLAFSPETILAQYGAPSSVEFQIAMAPSDGSSQNIIFYVMTMYFDSSDLVIEYDSKLIKDEEFIKVCPYTDNYDGVSVWLGKNADNVPTEQGAALEDATSLTIEQFYTLMLQEPETACFDLSKAAVMQKP